MYIHQLKVGSNWGGGGVSPIDPSTLPGLLVDLYGPDAGNTIVSGRYSSMLNLGSIGQDFTEVGTDGPTVDSASFGVDCPLYGANAKLLNWPHAVPTSYPFGNYTDLSEATLILRVDQKTLNAGGGGLFLSTMNGLAGDVGFHAKYLTNGALQTSTGNGTIIDDSTSAAGTYATGKHVIEFRKRLATAGTQIAYDIVLDGVQVSTGAAFTPTATPQSAGTIVGNYVGGTVLYCNAVMGRLLSFDNLLTPDESEGVRLFLEAQLP